MKIQNVGFVGAGRITRIFLTRLAEMNSLPERVTVFDTNMAVAERLAEDFALVQVADSVKVLADSDVVFVSLHPPVIASALAELSPVMKEGCTLVSLAPKVKISAMAGLLPSKAKIVRLLPNAPSIIGKGYNPICFGPGFEAEDKDSFTKWLSVFGQTFNVEEKDIEAYAAIVAMGSTYFWFQWKKLVDKARELGLGEGESTNAVRAMLSGSIDTYFDSGMTADEVMDLIPVKPFADKESEIEQIYDEKINAIYSKIKS